MFSAELQKLKDNHKLVEVYTNERDTSKFDVGRIVGLSDDFFVLSAVNGYGRLDGLLLMETESILRLCEDSLYLNKIAALMRYYNEQPERVPIDDKYPVYSLLDFCRRNNRIASIDICNSGIFDAKGYVEDLDIDQCSIRQISDFGKNDGTTTMLLNDISYISCCSNQELTMEILSSELFDEMRSN